MIAAVHPLVWCTACRLAWEPPVLVVRGPGWPRCRCGQQLVIAAIGAVYEPLPKDLRC